MSNQISALEAIRSTCKVTWRAEPKLMTVAITLGISALIPSALLIVWLTILVSSLADGHQDMAIFATLCLAITTVASWLLRIYSDRPLSLFTEKATIALESRIAELQSLIGTIEHFERPEYLGRLAVLRNQVWRIVNIFGSLSTLMGAFARLAITIAILIYVDPLLILLTIFALPITLNSGWRAKVMQNTWLNTSQDKRMERRLFGLGTTAGPSKELRTSQTRKIISLRRREKFETRYKAEAHQRLLTALYTTGTWIIFVTAYISSVYYVAQIEPKSLGNVLIVLIAGVNFVLFLTATTDHISGLRFMLEAARQLSWLENWVKEHEEKGKLPPPSRMTYGIKFENISFTYPGTDQVVLENINLHINPGSVVAIVGENGAGKTSLVKLLTRLYDPSSGRILIDNIDLVDIRPQLWRASVSGAFQDAFKFEYKAIQTVGIGDLNNLTNREIIQQAVVDGAADSVIDNLPNKLDTQLGSQWPNGTDLSSGQWQRLALARGLMLPNPLLLIFDEPTASLDPETEYELFERFTATARQGKTNGAITILVSHRFSTVKMADQIIVIKDKTIIEHGHHNELMALDGTYAKLFLTQAKAYDSEETETPEEEY